MTEREARTILLLYRPGTDDENDPEIARALALARENPGLRSWLAKEQASQAAMRAKFRGIAVPPHLKRKLLAERKIVRPKFRRSHTLLIAAAAMVVLLAVIAALVWPPPDATPRFAQFQARMVSTVLRQYRMEVASADMAAVRGHMAKHGAPADYVVTRGLERVPLAGGGVLRWHGQPVSMVCFYRRQTPEDKEMLYLFVLRKSALPDPPAPVPHAQDLKGMSTMSWTDGENIYLLTGPQESGFAENYR
jgi:hypothetical protein